MGMTSDLFSVLLQGPQQIKLKELNISINEWVRDIHLEELALCPNLYHLDLSCCPKLTSIGMDALLQKEGKDFQQICLKQNPKLSGHCFRRLEDRFGHVLIIV